MADRAGKPVEPDDDQRVAGGDIAQQARQHRARAVGAGGVFLVYGGAAGGAQFVGLRIGALFLGRDAGVADQCRSYFPTSVSPLMLQWTSGGRGRGAMQGCHAAHGGRTSRAAQPPSPEFQI
jgi:hypothetical protein